MPIWKMNVLTIKRQVFIVNTSKISGPKRSVKITDRFTCTSANVIYCITCTLCNKLYIGETGVRPINKLGLSLKQICERFVRYAVYGENVQS